MNTLDSVSSSQAEPKQPQISKIRPKIEQKKFSLVPFSAEVKVASEYDGNESFEPYETSKEFPKK